MQTGINADTPLRCLIIDDDPIARKGLRSYIQKLEHITVVGEGSNAADADRLLNANPVDIVYMDIHMPGMNGFEFARSNGRNVNFVFITGDADYAVESYRINAADYLMKPLSFDRFSDSYDKVCAQLSQKPSMSEDRMVFLQVNKRKECIPLSQILYVSGMQNYFRVHLTDGKTLLVHATLKKVSKLIPSEDMITIHRSYIVNKQHVRSVSGSELILADETVLPIGRTCLKSVRQLFQN